MSQNWTLADVYDFAESAHARVENPDGTLGQLRKYTYEPYIQHPLTVAGIVCTASTVTLAMMAAAILHDVVEDTPVALTEIRERFGDEVAQLVDWLTDASTPADGNRAARKTIDRERLARAPREVQTIKLADLIANTMSIVANDPRFARTYLQEKMALLDIMNQGDARLYKRARKLCDEGLARLEATRMTQANYVKARQAP